MAERNLTGGLSRRDVLKGAAGAAVLAGVGWPVRAGAAPEPDYDCIVLGAGISGVTAARDLHRQGFRVLVLEGAGRVGGRMFTNRDFVRHERFRDRSADYPLEMGAEYVHVGPGKRYRAFHDELASHGFDLLKFPKFARNRMAFPRTWKKNPKQLPIALLRDFDLIPTVTLLPDVDAYSSSRDVPAGEFIRSRKKFKRKGIHLARYTLSSHTPGHLFDPAVDRPAARFCPETAPEVVDTVSVAGMKADRLPDQLFYEQAELRTARRRGEDLLISGYDSLPHLIADQVRSADLHPGGRPGEILLGHRVLRVERAPGGLAVTAAGPDGQTRRFVGRTVLSTFSVGMLDPRTGQGEAIFSGLLTEDKRRALASLEMGAITKFSLEFKKRHWGCKNRMSVLSSPTGCARTFFSAFPDHRRGPYVLTGLLMNRDHRIIQSLDDEAAVRFLLENLQGIFEPRGKPWTPERVLVGRGGGASFEPNFSRQDWEKDPFARGGNSYIRYRPEVDTATVAGLRQRLRDPRPTTPLFWAGEATAPAYDGDYQPLSVHGAYISGVGAARDVAAYLEMDGDADAFANRFAESERLVREATLAPPPAALEVRLKARDLARLEVYAAANTEGDLDRAALDLLRVGLYLQEQQPKRISAGRAGFTGSVTLSLTGRERERLEAYAREHTGGDLEAAARAVLERALREAELSG